MKYTKTLLAVAAMAALTISCSDKDIFDKESYNQLIADAFPVKNIDPNQTWSTISSASVEITLSQKDEGNCLVALYDSNPSEAGAKLYGKKSIASGETFSTSINYLTANPNVYIQVTSPKGYQALYIGTISNGALTTTVGNKPVTTTKTRAAASPLTRAGEVTYSFISDLSDSEYPEAAPSDCKELIGDEKIQIEDNTSYLVTGDFTLNLDGKKNVNVYVNGTYTMKGDAFGENTTLYLLNGAELTAKDFKSTQTSNSKIVICEGATLKTLEGKQMQIDGGIEVYNRGTIIVGSDLYIRNSSALYNRGILSTTKNLSIDDSKKTDTSSQLINADSISCGGSFVHRGAFYNDQGRVYCIGLVSIQFKFDTDQNVWVNNGTFTTENKFTVENDSKGSTQFINYCRLNVGAGMEFGHDQNDSSVLQFDNEGGVYVTNDFITHQATTINLAGQSIFKCTNFEPQFATITGTSSEYPALIKASGNFDGGDNKVELIGYIYIECAGKKASNCVTTQGNIVSIFNTGEADISISGDCTGNYTGKPSTDSGTTDNVQITEEDISKMAALRYCYEDNFPQPGDYDMNDVVLDIKPIDLGDTKARYDISLAAIGATKQLAGALCLRNISSSEIYDITFGDRTFFDWEDTPSSSDDLIMSKFSDGVIASDAYTYTDSPVIFLFNDAHYAMLSANGEKTDAGDGSRLRPFINTVQNSVLGVGQEAKDVTAVTYSLFVDFTSTKAKEKALLASNIDPFIVETTNGIAWEVHTFEYKTDYVLFGYDNMDNYRAEMATWAIQVDGNFKYPREFINIANAVSNDEPCAYPDFSSWAADMNSYVEWYNNPNDGQVYE